MNKRLSINYYFDEQFSKLVTYRPSIYIYMHIKT
jgi:hypothetical protein